MFYVFGSETYGILAVWPGIELVPPELEGELTTGLPGKTLPSLIWNFIGSDSGLAGSREKCVAARKWKLFHRIKSCGVKLTLCSCWPPWTELFYF